MSSPDRSAAHTGLQHFQTTSTLDDPGPGLLLRVVIEDGHYHVVDFVGTRYGFAPFLADALAGWMEQVEDILGMSEPLGDPLKSEVRRYRKALSR
jgi:hypothetical protein